MAEYIDRALAKEEVKHIPWCDWEAVGESLDSITAADVEVVKHGRWDDSNRLFACIGFSACSNCGKPCEKTPYCPNCGAKMDLEVTNGLDQH